MRMQDKLAAFFCSFLSRFSCYASNGKCSIVSEGLRSFGKFIVIAGAGHDGFGQTRTDILPRRIAGDTKSTHMSDMGE